MLDNGNNARTLRGTLIMIAGGALLLHTLDLIQAGLSFVLIVVAVSAIVYGAYISGLYTFVRNFISKRGHLKPTMTPEQSKEPSEKQH